MPSDRREPALEALRPRIDAFRSAVAGAVDEVRALLDAQQAPENGRTARAAAELGAFASGHIDVERFASLLASGETLDPSALERVEAALETMRAVLDAGDDTFVCRVAAGDDLRDVVRSALAAAGRAFGAVRAVEAVRAGREPRSPDDDAFPPELWSANEWRVAPPLVVEVQGSDLRPAGLADYLDGGAALVLLVRPPAPPAALARLMTPGTLVVQGPDVGGLDLLRAWDGPAAIGVIEGAAEFVYTPAAGDGAPVEASLSLTSVPEAGPRSLGSLTAARQAADLALLRLLADAEAARVAAAVGGAAGAGGRAEPLDPAGRLAAWLLRQTDVSVPGAA